MTKRDITTAACTMVKGALSELGIQFYEHPPGFLCIKGGPAIFMSATRASIPSPGHHVYHLYCDPDFHTKLAADIKDYLELSNEAE